MKIIVSNMIPALKTVAYPRSLGRSKRRAARGYPQHHHKVPNTEAIQMGDTIYVTQAQYDALRRHSTAL